MILLRCRHFLVVLLSSIVYGDYDCVCNYNVEKFVLPLADDNAQPLGSMYDYDCKPTYSVQSPIGYISIQFQKQIGYVAIDQHIKIQTCRGSPNNVDLIPTTLAAGAATEDRTSTTPQLTTFTTTQPILAATATTPPRTTTTTTTTQPILAATATTPPRTTTTTTTTPEPIPTTSTSTPQSTPTTTTTTPEPTTIATTTTPQPISIATTTTHQPTTIATTTTPQPTTSTTTTTHQPSTTATTTTEPTTTTITTTPQRTTTTTKTTRQATPTTTTTTPLPTINTITPIQSTTTSSTKIPSTNTTKPSTTTTSTQFQSTTSSPKDYWSSSANVSGTPYQYVGVGYNLLTENPETGFNTKHQIFQLTGTPNKIHEVTYVKHTACIPHKTTTLLHGSKAYQDELKTLVRPDPSHSDLILKEAFMYNSQFISMQRILDGPGILYLDVLTTCKLGTVRYNTDNATQGHFAVTREFARDVCALPKEMTTSSITHYLNFIDKWGTSIVTSVDLGTKLLERYTTTEAEVVQHVQQTDTQLLEPRGPFEGFSSSVIINTHDFGNSKASQKALGVLNKTSSFGVLHNQAPIGGEVVPITDALDMNYWRTIIDQAVAEKICPDFTYGTDLDNYKTNIKNALHQYDGNKRNMYPDYYLLDRHTIQVPITWPYGTYGLMKAATGCPSNNIQWQEGWRKQDTDSNGRNEYSPAIANYMSGDFYTQIMTTWFCMKTSEHSSLGGQYDQQWPKGSYCILKKTYCPTGFSAGYIFWDDENSILGNVNAYGGTLPDGYYDDDTKVYYCCRNDGLLTNSILLPTDQPFILIRYSIRCQYVYWMSVADLFIKWDDENTGNTDIVGGMHPLDDGFSTDHRLHFCFYRKTGAPSIIG